KVIVLPLCSSILDYRDSTPQGRSGQVELSMESVLITSCPDTTCDGDLIRIFSGRKLGQGVQVGGDDVAMTGCRIAPPTQALAAQRQHLGAELGVRLHPREEVGPKLGKPSVQGAVLLPPDEC